MPQEKHKTKVTPADGAGILQAPTDPLLSWNKEGGTITYAPTGKRLFLMTNHAWIQLEEALFLNLLKGAPPLVFEMGRAYGKALVLDNAWLGENTRSVPRYLEDLWDVSGWGKMEIGGDPATGRKSIVRVADCVFCSSNIWSTAGRSSCYFLTGVTKGVMDTAYDWPHSVRESRCRLRGDELCELEIESERYFEQKAKRWGFRVYFPELMPLESE
jgi:predicted hydrocarbon binding protein